MRAPDGVETANAGLQADMSLGVQVDCDVHRSIDGQLTPFEVRATDWGSASAEKFSDVTHKQPLNPARWARPGSRTHSFAS